MSLHTPEYKHLLELLKQQRLHKGLTQVELSKRLKTTQQYVSRCEGGQRRLDVIELLDWCEALGVDSLVLYESIQTLLRQRKEHHAFLRNQGPTT